MGTSIVYNYALAESNTELVTNTVILLFVNDIDEHLLDVLESMAPNWVSNRYQEIEISMANRTNDNNNRHEWIVNQSSRFGKHRFAGISERIVTERNLTILDLISTAEENQAETETEAEAETETEAESRVENASRREHALKMLGLLSGSSNVCFSKESFRFQNSSSIHSLVTKKVPAIFAKSITKTRDTFMLRSTVMLSLCYMPFPFFKSILA